MGEELVSHLSFTLLVIFGRLFSLLLRVLRVPRVHEFQGIQWVASKIRMGFMGKHDFSGCVGFYQKKWFCYENL